MAEAEESTVAETKKVINPRVEIDTSPPFESVKEAVDRFGGGGPWIPGHLLRLASDQHGSEEFDLDKVEEQASQLERDLIKKEQETLLVLRELEAAKRYVEGLKLTLLQEMSTFVASSDMKRDVHSSAGSLSLCPVASPGVISMELNQAKLNLSKTTTNLAVIQASVESLNKKIRNENMMLQKINGSTATNDPKVIPTEENFYSSKIVPHQSRVLDETGSNGSTINALNDLQELNYEAEQFKKMTEASKYEVMKAMYEIERTKTSIKMAEMRLTAARKMEEAAKAVEAIAIAEKYALSDSKSPEVLSHKSHGITLSFEEYSTLTHRAHQAEEFCRTKFIDSNIVCQTERTNQSEVSITKKSESTTREKRRTKKSLEEAMGTEDKFDRRTMGNDGNSSGETLENEQTSYEQQNANRFRFRNWRSSVGHRRSQAFDENGSNLKPAPVYRSTISIGDILTRKLVLQDDIVVGKHMERHAEREEVSLSEMLREQSGLLLHPTKPMKDGTAEKQYHSQRKKFGFIHVSIPRQGKKKAQVVNRS